MMGKLVSFFMPLQMKSIVTTANVNLMSMGGQGHVEFKEQFEKYISLYNGKINAIKKSNFMLIFRIEG